MNSNSQENSGKVNSPPTGKAGLLNQWGGGFTFFFTYMHLSHDLITGLLAALLPFIREDLGLNYLQSGLLVTAFSLTAGLSQLFGGWLSDRISKVKAITLGLGGVGVSAILISFAPNYHFLLVLLVALGFFAGFYHPSAISVLSTHFETQHRGRALALHMVGGGLGFGLGPLLGAIIASNFNWHLAYALLGIPPLVAAGFVLTRLKLKSVQPRKAVSASQQPAKKPGNVWQVFKPAIGVIAISLAMQLLTGPVMSFVSLFLMDVHHLSATAGSMWVTIIRFGGLAGNLVGGWLTDKWGRRNTIFLTLMLYGPVVLLMAKLPYGIALGISFVVFGWLMAMRETTMQTLLMDSSPPEMRATVIGIYFSFGQQGSSIIQPVAGNIMDAIGIGGVFNWISFISVGLSFITLILAWRYSRQAKTSVNTP
jgi:MFS transporter, FSR family, fosmidomycin resistance protein